MRKRISAAVVGLGIVGVSLLSTSSASSHGYSDAPISRQALCANHTVTDCGAIQYEPQSVEGPKGFPAAGPADGKICSGGHDGFAQLDDPRGGKWPGTKLAAGQGYTFSWRLTARHSTTDFEYFITKDGYDPTKPLTRADLEPQPFMTVPMGGVQPGSTVQHQGTIPTQKSGRHLILGVWNIADTGNAFYACSDVDLS
ncbi:lytic polysaccharide monooxygenase auxiliary activity family 9 protein [Streptomyces celluloflavus]|uniref:lytic polysaccharide monooxygenase auxiliary activity family 9 protein n=1 Tax=Streptomyces TaxID=1883 RepID=UPI00069B2C58|nr:MULTISPECIES: lytic polysaccharide monooxygenase auxiliary activity family 9 protein [Streptomyces]MYU53239.1 chitin-binding protein [Streptomyces sp. SID7805]